MIKSGAAKPAREEKVAPLFKVEVVQGCVSLIIATTANLRGLHQSESAKLVCHVRAIEVAGLHAAIWLQAPHKGTTNIQERSKQITINEACYCLLHT